MENVNYLRQMMKSTFPDNKGPPLPRKDTRSSATNSIAPRIAYLHTPSDN